MGDTYVWNIGIAYISQLFIAALIFSAGYYSAPILLQFKEFELYWGAIFFLRSVHTISWFFNSNWSSDFGHAGTGSGAKKRVVLRREFFGANFEVEWENGVWTKNRFLAGGFFCSHASQISTKIPRFFTKSLCLSHCTQIIKKLNTH